jgi:ubiquinone/menaquinone biosynthesis C-methylase UbiE
MLFRHGRRNVACMRAHHDADAATHEHPAHDGTADAGLAELLDLDGDVLRSYWTDALTWVRHAATGSGRARILDLGAGTGTGTIALAQRFGGAEVIAVDVSEEMLSRIRVKALDEGLAHRIRTVQADLNVAWPAIDPVDITWASMSLHHMANPDRVLGDVFATTRPRGLVAVAEIAEPLRFLPHDVGFGRPGFEDRCLDALGKEHAQSVPQLGSEWAPRLEAAGFTVLSERTFAIELNAPHPTGTARYAQLWFRRLNSALAHLLAHEDLQTLATLIDGDGPESLQQRGDLQVRGSRTVTLARRP